VSSEDAQRSQMQVYWEVIGDAVGALRAGEARDTYASVSFDELVDLHVSRLNSSTDPTRLDRLAQVNKIKTRLTERIEAIKEIPPQRFRRKVKDDEVNTPVEGEGTP
jgi:hypothetical protein